MPTIHRQDGFQFRIFTADHPPPHVHAYKAGAVVKIGLGDAETGPYISTPSGMDAREQVRAVRIAAEYQAMMLSKWRRIHG